MHDYSRYYEPIFFNLGTKIKLNKSKDKFVTQPNWIIRFKAAV